MRKPVLIITYYWPPSGGSAVQRWLSFANELASLGHAVHVLTVHPTWATYQLYDESLVQQIHPSVQVHTTKTREPFAVYKKLFGKGSIPAPAFANETAPSLTKKIMRAIRGNLFIPDPRRGWKAFALPAAENLIAQHHIATVITAGPPHSTHFIGLSLKQKNAVKWIADFHDLWTDVIYYRMLYHLPIVKRWDKGLERKILETADLVVTVGEKYRQKLLGKSAAIAPEKIKILPIGYDASLFTNVGQDLKSTQNFTVTYTGSMADFYQPQVFFDAVAALPDAVRSTVRLVFAGVLAAGIKAYVRAAGLQQQFEEKGYLPHTEAVRLLRASDALLLVNPVTTDEAMVIPGKLYEYLAAHRPIINITVPDAETATIIADCSAGKTFSRTEQEAITDYLLQLINSKQNSVNAMPSNIHKVSRYSRQNEAALLSTWL